MLEQVQKRRSIRQYQKKPIGQEILERILNTGLSVPSSRGRQPWEFLVVQEKYTLQALGKCRHPQQGFLPQAAAAIVVFADPSKSDVWVEDSSIAMILMQMEAEENGLGSCWVQVRRRMAQGEQETSDAYVKRVLHIPNSYEVLAILSLGWPAEEKEPRMVQAEKEKIHVERYGVRPQWGQRNEKKK